MKNIILRFLLLMVICFPVNSETSIKPIIEGNVDAKIKLIVYESLTCSHCAKFHKEIYPQLKEQYIDTGLVTIEFKSFPLDIIALNASKIAHCRNDGKSEILHFLFKNQNDWVKGDTVEELNTNLKKVLNKQKFSLNFDKCLENKLVEDFVLEDRIEAVKKYKINATPTIIINEEKFDNPLNYKNLKKILEKLI